MLEQAEFDKPWGEGGRRVPWSAWAAGTTLPGGDGCLPGRLCRRACGICPNSLDTDSTQTHWFQSMPNMSGKPNNQWEASRAGGWAEKSGPGPGR